MAIKGGLDVRRMGQICLSALGMLSLLDLHLASAKCSISSITLSIKSLRRSGVVSRSDLAQSTSGITRRIVAQRQTSSAEVIPGQRRIADIHCSGSIPVSRIPLRFARSAAAVTNRTSFSLSYSFRFKKYGCNSRQASASRSGLNSGQGGGIPSTSRNPISLHRLSGP